MRTRSRNTEIPVFTTVTIGDRSNLWDDERTCAFTRAYVKEISSWTLPSQSHKLYAEKSTITDETTPRYEAISAGSLAQVPNFKDVRNVKFYVAFESGGSTTLTYMTSSLGECNRVYAQRPMPYKIITSGAPTDDWDRTQLYAYDFLKSKGLIPTFEMLESHMATYGLSMAKDLLSDTDSLLGFQESFNVLNFIAELKDVRKLPELLTKWTKSTHDISDKFLGYQFGVLPFKGDILAILNRLANTGPFIDKWNDMARNAKVANVHRNITSSVLGIDTTHGKDDPDAGYAIIENVYPTTPGNGTEFGGFGAPSGQAHSSSEISYRLKVRIMIHVYYVPIIIPDDLIDNIKRSIWGLDKPLEAVWNALPFSFVVDWFVNVGDMIAQFEKSEPLLTMKIVNVGYSISYKLEVQDRVKTEFTGFGTASAGRFTTFHESYTRKSMNPASVLTANKSYGPLRFSTIDKSQALLGSALLHQLLR